MAIEDRSRRRQAELGRRNGHHHSPGFRSRTVEKTTERQAGSEPAKPEIEPEQAATLIRVRERKTAEAAELLSQALGDDGVALLLDAFAEEEHPGELLAALRRRLQVAMAVKNGNR